MSEKELLDVIDVIASQLANKFAFAHFEAADLKQEIFLMACHAIVRSYDGKRPLENFLWKHCKNRTINFKRDNYYRGGQVSEKQERINTIKRNLLNTVDIDMVECSEDATDSTFEQAYLNETLAMIDDKMPVELREYWLKMRNGVPITAHRKSQIESILKEIIGDDIDE